MTEIQLQAILDSKGDAEGELDVDMMTNASGKRISKFGLEAISIGLDVTDDLLKEFMEFCQP